MKIISFTTISCILIGTLQLLAGIILLPFAIEFDSGIILAAMSVVSIMVGISFILFGIKSYRKYDMVINGESIIENDRIIDMKQISSIRLTFAGYMIFTLSDQSIIKTYSSYTKGALESINQIVSKVAIDHINMTKFES